jgi:hypothetical protein
VSPDECQRLGKDEAQAWIDRSLQAFMPGDEVRSLQHQTRFVDESLDLALVPVWTFAMRYHPRKPTVRVLVNGQTGQVGGVIPFSWAKLGLIVLLILLLVATVVVVGILSASVE